MSSKTDERYERQIRMFGAKGQATIGRARLAILGLGGLGSQLAQQLAYLGVHDFVLVDDDTVEPTNLNRLIGATEHDIGRLKVEVAHDLIMSVQPKATVAVHKTHLPDTLAQEAATTADIIVGCFDNDYPRLLTTAFAAAAGKPYVDAASDIDTSQGLVYGGRVLVSGTTRGCLSCLGMLDQADIRRAQLSKSALETEAKIYGVPANSLTATGPSVVTINGVVASLAATEVMAILTGIRAPAKLQRYQGNWPIITHGNPSSVDCFYCNQWLTR